MSVSLGRLTNRLVVYNSPVTRSAIIGCAIEGVKNSQSRRLLAQSCTSAAARPLIARAAISHGGGMEVPLTRYQRLLTGVHHVHYYPSLVRVGASYLYNTISHARAITSTNQCIPSEHVHGPYIFASDWERGGGGGLSALTLAKTGWKNHGHL